MSEAFTQSQKATVHAMSSLTGVIGRLEEHIEAWEKHYLPHLVQNLPVYIPPPQRLEPDDPTPVYDDEGMDIDILHVHDNEEVRYDENQHQSDSIWCSCI